MMFTSVVLSKIPPRLSPSRFPAEDALEQFGDPLTVLSHQVTFFQFVQYFVTKYVQIYKTDDSPVVLISISCLMLIHKCEKAKTVNKELLAFSSKHPRDLVQPHRATSVARLLIHLLIWDQVSLGFCLKTKVQIESKFPVSGFQLSVILYPPASVL